MKLAGIFSKKVMILTGSLGLGAAGIGAGVGVGIVTSTSAKSASASIDKSGKSLVVRNLISIKAGSDDFKAMAFGQTSIAWFLKQLGSLDDVSSFDIDPEATASISKAAGDDYAVLHISKNGIENRFAVKVGHSVTDDLLDDTKLIANTGSSLRFDKFYQSEVSKADYASAAPVIGLSTSLQFKPTTVVSVSKVKGSTQVVFTLSDSVYTDVSFSKAINIAKAAPLTYTSYSSDGKGNMFMTSAQGASLLKPDMSFAFENKAGLENIVKLIPITTGASVGKYMAIEKTKLIRFNEDFTVDTTFTEVPLPNFTVGFALEDGNGGYFITDRTDQDGTGNYIEGHIKHITSSWTLDAPLLDYTGFTAGNYSARTINKVLPTPWDKDVLIMFWNKSFYDSTAKFLDAKNGFAEITNNTGFNGAYFEDAVTLPSGSVLGFRNYFDGQSWGGAAAQPVDSALLKADKTVVKITSSFIKDSDDVNVNKFVRNKFVTGPNGVPTIITQKNQAYAFDESNSTFKEVQLLPKSVVSGRSVKQYWVDGNGGYVFQLSDNTLTHTMPDWSVDPKFAGKSVLVSNVQSVIESDEPGNPYVVTNNFVAKLSQYI